MKLDWQDKETAAARIGDKMLLPLLFHSGSLTQFIQQQCKGKFEVELQSENWRIPMPDEADSLKVDSQTSTFIRESWLKSDGHYLVYARSIIPRDTFEQISQELLELGNRPLGELLFADESGYRSEMSFASVPANCELFSAARANAGANDELWARQSLFYIRHKPILIIEVFLPAIEKCIEH